MKRNVCSLMLVFLAFGFAASAQTEKGSWLVGGNLELNTPSGHTTIGFQPMAGYFLINNFAVGAKVKFNYDKVASSKTTILGAGPFARYYLGTMNIRPFAEADLSFNSNKSPGSKAKNSSDFFLGGGLAAFINRNVAIEGIAGYSHTSLNSGSGGFKLGVGFQVYLSRAQVANLKSNL